MLLLQPLFIIWLYNFECCTSAIILVSPISSKEAKRNCVTDRINYLSSNIAIKAAEEAKAAQYAQMPAASQAAYQVKEQLAEKAIEAAKAAQAALVGKVAMIEKLTREKEAVKIVLQEEVNSKLQLEQAINEGIKALLGVKNLLNIVSSGLKLAGTTAENADSTLRGVELDLRQKDILLQQAVHAFELFSREECMAGSELERTKCAARTAVQAAVGAKSNAMTNKRESNKNTPTLSNVS